MAQLILAAHRRLGGIIGARRGIGGGARRRVSSFDKSSGGSMSKQCRLIKQLGGIGGARRSWRQLIGGARGGVGVAARSALIIKHRQNSSASALGVSFSLRRSWRRHLISASH